MAQFKVGQRVRIVRIAPLMRDLSGGRIIGAQGVIVRSDNGFWAWVVDIPSVSAPSPSSALSITEWYCDPCRLEPLTDPKADQFLEWVRTLDKAPIRELQPDEMENVRSAG